MKGNKSQKATHPKDKHAITTLTDYINKTNDNGYTALHSAVLTGFQHGIEVLIQNNADISITNIENNTLVHTAAINNKVKSIQKVIDTLFSESKEGSFIWKQELQRKNGISYFPVMLATEKSTIKVHNVIPFILTIFRILFRYSNCFPRKLILPSFLKYILKIWYNCIP